VPKATIKIDIPALHPIAAGWNNISSIHSYKPEEFVSSITGVHDKKATLFYDVLRTFREGSNIKKSDNNQVSVADLMLDPDKDIKIEKQYRDLKNVLGPPKKLSLPYSNIKAEQRKEGLVQRIAQLFHNGNLDNDRAVHKVIHGHYDDGILLHYPFVIEIISIPFNDSMIKNGNIPSRFIDSINYSVSPRGNRLEGEYSWYDKKHACNYYASNITDILQKYGFVFYAHSGRSSVGPKVKLPCIIAANLVSPRIDYHGHDKSRIDTRPFSSFIIDAAKKISSETHISRCWLCFYK
jgi:hypothetical protein